MVKDAPSKPKVYSIPTDSEILMVCSTTEGMLSNRTFSLVKEENARLKKSFRSWFISALLDVLPKYAHKEDLMTMLTRVNNNVAQNHENFNSFQVCSITTTLTKHIYLT